MLTYILVSLFVFFQKRVWVRVKKILRIGLGLVFVAGLGLGFNFGMGNLIGGAVGTFGSSLARRLCTVVLRSHPKNQPETTGEP